MAHAAAGIRGMITDDSPPDPSAMGRLDAFIAQAADTWLTDPGDVASYARLVAAVRARRAHLAAGPPAAPASAPVSGDDVPADVQDDPGSEGEEVRPVGVGLDGDPREVLSRLRTGLR